MNDANAAVYRQALITLTGVMKVYRKNRDEVRALDGIDLSIPEKGMVAIVGASGSGKSSLLHLLGAMDRPSDGTIVVAGQELGTLSESGLTGFRRKTIGFVFQSFNLIPNLSALENVMLPMEFSDVPSPERQTRARDLLGRMGLGARLNHKPRELSGGEQQRVAIARALANNPPLILADEPTGNLDSKTGQMIYALLKEIAQERTVVVVTHAEALAQQAQRILHIRDGRLETDSLQHQEGSIHSENERHINHV